MKKYNWQGCYHCPLKNSECKEYKQNIPVTFIKDRHEGNWGTLTKVTSKNAKKIVSAHVKDNIVYCATDEFDFIDLDTLQIEE